MQIKAAHQWSECSSLLRIVLNLPPPLPPPSDNFINPPRGEEVQPIQCEPQKEDDSARGTILAQYYVDALVHGYEIGLSFWQCAVWATVFRDVHEEWICEFIAACREAICK